MRFYSFNKGKNFEAKQYRQEASIELISFIFEDIGVCGDNFINMYVDNKSIYAIIYKDKEKDVPQNHDLIFWQRSVEDKISLSEMIKIVTKKITKFIN